MLRLERRLSIGRAVLVHVRLPEHVSVLRFSRRCQYEPLHLQLHRQFVRTPVLSRATVRSLAAVSGGATAAAQLANSIPMTWILVVLSAILVGLVQQTLP